MHVEQIGGPFAVSKMDIYIIIYMCVDIIPQKFNFVSGFRVNKTLQVLWIRGFFKGKLREPIPAMTPASAP